MSRTKSERLVSSWAGSASEDLAAHLKASERKQSRWPLHRVHVRLPAPVADELQMLARAKEVSVNTLIALYIDAGLQADGRKGVMKLAPWFPDYVNRNARDGDANVPPDFS
jgi:hypothetical protein